MTIRTITLTPTNAGLAALSAANMQGLDIDFTHVALGSGLVALPTTTTALTAECERKTITSAAQLTDTQWKIITLFDDDPAAQYSVTEVGLIGDGVLFAYWVAPTAAEALVVRQAGTPYELTIPYGTAALPSQNINFVIDPGTSQAAEAMALHLDAMDPHTQYVRKDVDLTGTPAEYTPTEKLNARTNIQAIGIGKTASYTVANWAEFIQAINDLMRYRPEYGARATITLAAGFSWAGQLLIDGVDMSWIQINSTDLIVPVNRSTLTTLDTVSGRKSAVCVMKGGVSPTINFIAEMDNSGVAADGIVVHSGGKLIGLKVGFRKSEAGIFNFGGEVSIYGSVDNQQSTHGLYTHGGVVNIKGDVNVSQSSYGFNIASGLVNIKGNVTSNLCASVGLQLSSGLCFINGATDFSSNGYGILCETGQVGLYSGTCNATGCTNVGAYAVSGTITSRQELNTRKSATNGISDTIVFNGGMVMRAPGSTGGTNQAVGVMTDGGYINV